MRTEVQLVNGAKIKGRHHRVDAARQTIQARGDYAGGPRRSRRAAWEKRAGGVQKALDRRMAPCPSTSSRGPDGDAVDVAGMPRREGSGPDGEEEALAFELGAQLHLTGAHAPIPFASRDICQKSLSPHSRCDCADLLRFWHVVAVM